VENPVRLQSEKRSGVRTADLIVGFTAVTLVVTAVVLSVFNQRLERRTTQVVEVHPRHHPHDRYRLPVILARRIYL
jgi:hypothetical protein